MYQLVGKLNRLKKVLQQLNKKNFNDIELQRTGKGRIIAMSKIDPTKSLQPEVSHKGAGVGKQI